MQGELRVLAVPEVWQSQALAVSGIWQLEMHNSPEICLTCDSSSSWGPTVLGAQRPEGQSVLAVWWWPSGAREPQHPPKPGIQQLQMLETAPGSSFPKGLVASGV